MSSLYLKELSMGAMQQSGTLNWQFKQKHKNKTKHLTVEFASKRGENKDTSFTLEMERQHTIFSHIQQKKQLLLLLSEGDMSRMVGTNKCEKEMLNLIEAI